MSEVVLVDDDAEVLDINHKYLSKEGYVTHPFTSASKAIMYMRSHPADCVVLDVMMPHMSGFKACSEIRKFSDVPIIFLSGRTQEDDKIKGLLLGADDYVEKPCRMKELSARIMVNIRRKSLVEKGMNQGNTVKCSELTIDKTEHKVYYQDKEEIPLTNQEYDLLNFMAANPNRELTFQEIGEQLRGSYMESDRRIVMVNVSRLRKKLEQYVHLQNMIETVWSKGYSFRVK